MKTSIRIKFAVFISALLLVATVATAVLVLNATSRNQLHNAEAALDRQGSSANILLVQYVSADEYRDPQKFMDAKGDAFSQDLERISGMPVQLYDQTGSMLGAPEGPVDTAERGKQGQQIDQALRYATDGDIAFVTYPDSILYFSPLTIRDQPIGVVRFTYSREQDNEFYNQLRSQLITIGACVFVVAVGIGFAYFSRVAHSISRVNRTVQAIESGNYEYHPLRRRDEIGELSRGVQSMGHKIQQTLADNEAERHKLALAIDELNKLDGQQKELLIAVSHELKTPLTAIRAYLDLVDMYPEDQSLALRLRDTTDVETQRLIDMVQKVLRLTQAEKYDFEISQEALSVGLLASEVAASLAGKMKSRGVRYHQEVTPAHASDLVAGDKDLLTIVLINLVDNAIKYNRVGGSLAVVIRCSESAVIVDVQDSGAGIPSDHFQRIFDPFVTVDKSQSRATGGSGLGLAVARKYAERMGGSLVVARSDSSGTTMRLTLAPYGLAGAVLDAGAASGTAPSPSSSLPSNSLLSNSLPSSPSPTTA